jgi:hypothetical protein
MNKPGCSHYLHQGRKVKQIQAKSDTFETLVRYQASLQRKTRRPIEITVHETVLNTEFQEILCALSVPVSRAAIRRQPTFDSIHR